MAVVVLDASIVLGAVAQEDEIHDRCERALRASADADLVLPASAYAETLIRPLQLGRSSDPMDAFLSELSIAVVDIDRATARRAAEIRAAHGVPLPDALVLATGDVLDADEVLTGDRRWAGLTPRVRIV